MIATFAQMDRPKPRTTIRSTHRLTVSCWTDPALATPVLGRIRTLSTAGLSLSLPFLPSPRPYLEIELCGWARRVSLKLRVRVLYAFKQGAQGCVVGVSFPEKLAEEELAALVA
jgi:hypothetical protein